MIIREISYKATRSFGNYENESIEARAELATHENQEEVLVSLAAWVGKKLDERSDARGEDFALENRRSNLRSEIRDMERQAETARGRWETIKSFLARHGVSVNDLEIPF